MIIFYPLSFAKAHLRLFHYKNPANKSPRSTTRYIAYGGKNIVHNVSQKPCAKTIPESHDPATSTAVTLLISMVSPQSLLAIN